MKSVIGTIGRLPEMLKGVVFGFLSAASLTFVAVFLTVPAALASDFARVLLSMGIWWGLEMGLLLFLFPAEMMQMAREFWAWLEPELPWIIFLWLAGLSVIGAWSLSWVSSIVVSLTWAFFLPVLSTLKPDILPAKDSAHATTIFFKRST